MTEQKHDDASGASRSDAGLGVHCRNCRYYLAGSSNIDCAMAPNAVLAAEKMSYGLIGRCNDFRPNACGEPGLTEPGKD